MTKQLSEKQKVKIREAIAEAKECLKITKEIKVLMDEIAQEEHTP